MNIIKQAAQTGCIAAYLLVMNACNSTEAPSVDAPLIGKDGENAEILFTESFSGSGEITIVKDDQGNFGYGIQAPIGSDAAKLMESTAPRLSLADVYSTLNGGKASIPAIVSEASEKLGDRLPAGPHEDPIVPALRALPKGASLSAFSTGYCRDIYELSFIWKWQGCFWLQSDVAIMTPWVDSDGWTPNRVYAWNATPYTATLKLWKNDGSGLANSWQPTQSPYTVSWFQWGGTYSQANAWMYLPAGKRGELGMVTHRPVVRPPR
jgi:hypothetical protein